MITVLRIGCSGVLAACLSGTFASAMTTAVPPQDGETLTVPAGTSIPLTLVSLVMSKSTPLGSVVRATVAFPITVGTQLAIPAGTFAEGQLVQDALPKGTKIKRGQNPPSALKIHFTRLIYPNGYTVTLNGEVAQRDLPVSIDAAPVYLAFNEALSLPGEPLQQTYPPLPPTTTPNVYRPSTGLIVGITVGPLVAVGAIAAYGVHRFKQNADRADVQLFAPGYQLQMNLTTPLTLDGSRISPVTSTP